MKIWQLVFSVLSVCGTDVFGLCIPKPPHCMAEIDYSTILPCHMSNAKPNLNCTYIPELGYVTPPATLSPCDISSPAKPSDMQVSLYHWSYTGGCWPVLNISWRLPNDASAKYFTGFMLNVTGQFDAEPVSMNKIRNFSLTITAPLNTLNPETVFMYDCLPLYPGSQFRIALQSLPASSSRENSNVTMIYVPEPSISVAHGSSDSCQKIWSAEATVAPSASRSSIIVTFPAAPTCYRFTKYSISLIDYYDEVLLQAIYSKIVIPSDDRVYHEFTDVCPRTYKVFIKPMLSDTCECEKTDEYGDVSCGDCVATVIGPIDMNASYCPKSPKPTGKNGPNCSTLYAPSTSGPSIYQIIGAAAGAVLGALLITLVVVIIIKYTKRPSTSGVLLVYSHEHIKWHADVIYKLADFLEHVCGVKVVNIWNKSECDLSLVDWVKKELRRVNDVVVCHSFDSNYYATGTLNSQLNTLEAFLSLWHNMRQNRSKIRYGVQHVFFDYCMSRSDAAVVASRIGGSETWFMPDDMEHFIKKICDSSRARKLATSAYELTETVEGRHLKEAIRAASYAVQADDLARMESISVGGTRMTDVSSTVVDMFMQVPFKPPIKFICPADDNVSLRTDFLESQEIGLNRDYDKDLH